MDAVLPPAQGCGELYDTEGLHRGLKLQINRNQTHTANRHRDNN